MGHLTVVRVGGGGRGWLLAWTPWRVGPTRTRARILEVALELMATQGFSATSTREMSERLGFTKAALYYHFHTKDDLLGALVAPILDGLAELTDTVPAGVGISGRRQLLAGYVDLVAAHEKLIRLLSEDPSASQHPVVQGRRAHIRAPDRVTERGGGAGHCRPGQGARCPRGDPFRVVEGGPRRGPSGVAGGGPGSRVRSPRDSLRPASLRPSEAHQTGVIRPR